MLEHWLQPIQPAQIQGFDALTDEQIGRKIHFFQTSAEGEEDSILKKAQIALVGIGADDANAVRAAFYTLSNTFDKINIVDLGNVRKQETSFIIPLLSELLQADILPIIIGHSDIFTLAQYQAYQSKKNSVSVAIIDEKIRFTPKIQSDSYALHQILENEHLFNCSIIGYQTHFTTPSVLEYFEQRNFELIRLGRTKNNMEEIEPVIRDADMVSFNLGVLKAAEAPAQLIPSPSGLFSEDVCQLARYAGMSDKLTSLSIIGFQEHLDTHHQTAQIVAQMIWYFIDGFKNRKQDFPISKAFNQLTQYIVHIREFDYNVTFWKSNKSGRWWMEIPLKSRKKHDRHRLVPCSYNDYQKACNGELPDRLVYAYQRFK